MSRWIIPVVALMVFGCAIGQASDAGQEAEGPLLAVPYYKTMIGETSWGINYLHQLNIGDIEGLRENLRTSLAIDAVMLYSTAQHKEIAPKEKDRILSVLLLMSVQNEKYPVKTWDDNEELKAVFNKVQENNPSLLEEMRARNWNKPMWVE